MYVRVLISTMRILDYYYMPAMAMFLALFQPNTEMKFVEILCTNQVVMAFIIIVMIVFVFVIFHCFPVMV